MAKRLSIINFKGGVGKTSLALHVGSGLARYHEVDGHRARVLLVDVDHQSTLSWTVLGFPAWEQAVQDRRTVNEVFRSYTDRGVAMPGDAIISLAPYGPPYQTMDLVSATLDLDDTELDLGATSYPDSVHPMWPKLNLILQWLDKNNIDERYDYVIFDCPPATKLVTRNALACSHGYVIPVIPDRISSRGLPHLIRLLDRRISNDLVQWADQATRRGFPIPSTFTPNTRLAGIAISMIGVAGNAASGYVDEHTIELNALQNGPLGAQILESHIHSGEGVRRALGRGRPVYDFPNEPNIWRRGHGGQGFIRNFRDLTQEIKDRVDAL